MGNTASAKGNPAWKRMMNPANKLKRQKNKSKNELLKAKGQHPKQLRNKENERRADNNQAMSHNHTPKWTHNDAETARKVFGAKIGPNRVIGA